MLNCSVLPVCSKFPVKSSKRLSLCLARVKPIRFFIDIQRKRFEADLNSLRCTGNKIGFYMFFRQQVFDIEGVSAFDKTG